MSQIVLICPHCNMRLGTSTPPAAGTVLTCPTCSKQFAAPQAGPPAAQPAPPRPAPPRAAPPKPPQIQAPQFQAPVFPPQPQFAPLQQPAYVPPVYPQYQASPSYSPYNTSPSNSNSKGLIIGLSIGGGVLAVLLIVGVVILISYGRGTPVAQVPDAPVGVQSSPIPAELVPGVAPAKAGTPFLSTAGSGSTVRQLPIVGADAALAYRWVRDKNYDYDYELNAKVDATQTSYVGSASYKLDPQTSERLARLVGADGPQEGSGTAFVVHSDGLLVTCAHVVRGSTKVSVTVGTSTYPGDVVGVDDRHDLALIRVAASNLPAVPLGNSDTVQLAEEVRAVGYPLSDVLGTSVKITRGTIAGVVTKNGDRLLQIDASINPGNSGGPLFNDRGEVVGINSAGLVGESITNVGFAVPANYALALLRSKGISPTAVSGNKVLAGPVLAAAVTPAVAYVKVDMGKSESLQILEYNGFCAKAGAMVGRASANHVSDRGQLILSPTGEVLKSDAEAQLPLLLMPLHKLAIEKLPSDGDKEWESRRVTALLLPDRPTESINPFGPGRRTSRSPLGRPQQRGLTIIPATEQIKYRITGETADALEISKSLDISSMDPEGGTPSFQITGSGNITWDKKHGVPRLIKQTMTMAVQAGGARATVPMDLKIELTGVNTDAERIEKQRQKAGSIPAPTSFPSSSAGKLPAVPTLPTTPLPKDSLDEHLAALKGKSKDAPPGEVSLPLVHIAFMQPVPSRREEVAAAVDPFLLAKEEGVRRTALMAIAKWGTQKSIPTLLKALEAKDVTDRGAAIKALGEIGDNKMSAEAIAKRMSSKEDMLVAADALKLMGPFAEDAVWQHVGASDPQLHSNACRVLGSVGTQKSLTKLQALIKKETEIGHRLPMETAVRSIQRRLG